MEGLIRPPSDCTLLVHAGRDPQRHAGLVNTPVHRGSTVLATDLDEWERKKLPDNPMAAYGRFGSPTTRSLESAVTQMEGGHASIVFPSGLSACTHALLALLKAGDHVLMTDSVYGPVRAFARNVLARLGIETTFFDPELGAGIRGLMRANTRVVYLESPGSWTLEMQDVPALCAEARRAGARVVMDNTWATPLFFRPLAHGVDVSVQSATKYLVGHSDALLGVVTANAETWPVVRQGTHDFGQIAGPDDVYLALRGMRTLDVRMRRHWENGMVLAESLRGLPLVERVLHPALEDHPGHALWRRDFSGASGLFSVVLRPVPYDTLRALFSNLRLFGIGLSWGGYESLALLSEPTLSREAKPWPYRGRLLRIHAGLEDVDDLVADMRQAITAAAEF
jgi:cystathionine beta-lyase